jgi:Tfp pilus assembly protein PilZ
MQTQQTAVKEMRAYPRVPVKIPVKYRVISEGSGYGSFIVIDEEKTSNITDMSIGGFTLVTLKTLKIGSVLALKIFLPSKGEWVSAFAEVAWANPTGAGLHFLVMNDGDVKTLKDFIDKNLTPMDSQ